MAFNHLAGATTRGAADEIADWFATFQDWIVNTVGWTLEAGGGTTNLRLSSIGEGGTYTKLFVHVWRDGVTEHIRGEVSDDALPTHETNDGGFLDGDGVRFQYWMSADLDAMCLVIPYRHQHHVLYLGIVEPVAINPADETYHMVASYHTLLSCSILRNHTGIWDVDINNDELDGASNQRPSLQGGNFCPHPLLANEENEIAGQYKFISSRIVSGGVQVGDEFTSDVGGATSVWKVFWAGSKFALQIAGAPPGDVLPGASLAMMTGVAVSSANFIAILDAFCTGIGWTVTDPGAPYNSRRLFYSQGESGLNNIYCLLGETITLHPHVQNDAGGTIQTPQMNVTMIAADYPTNFWIAADLDGIAIVIERPGAVDNFIFMGFPHLACPGIADIYNMVSWTASAGISWILRSRRPNFPNAAALNYRDSHQQVQNSNANAFDPNTYCLWPTTVATAGVGGGVPLDPIGDLRYISYTDGGGIARLDTITAGAEIHTVFDTTGAGSFLTLRTT